MRQYICLFPLAWVRYQATSPKLELTSKTVLILHFDGRYLARTFMVPRFSMANILPTLKGMNLGGKAHAHDT